MRINEAYEHEPILPHPAEESCPLNGCNKIGTQCVDVSEPVILTPTASVGTITVTCQGTPSVVCVTDAAESSCTVTLTQKVCVAIPVRFGVSMAPGEASIACAAGSTGCACCC
ncbi:hypothetical protein [Oscillibacter sp.]|uniref:hypothetical protein n=1 Tax=Oscillibacter sp. TaxID=1945593 RepID=UPI002637F072|nr:hypothetical protein [Oscillibacter sp.]MDD3346956.1 hypothetical protein [Oscillibacter sp.]